MHNNTGQSQKQDFVQKNARYTVDILNDLISIKYKTEDFSTQLEARGVVGWPVVLE
jgi:hypothetical protein